MNVYVVCVLLATCALVHGLCSPESMKEMIRNVCSGELMRRRRGLATGEEHHRKRARDPQLNSVHGTRVRAGLDHHEAMRLRSAKVVARDSHGGFLLRHKKNSRHAYTYCCDIKGMNLCSHAIDC